MTTWAIVPVKPLNRAKSRLSEILEPEQRETLALGMMSYVLEVLTRTPKLDGVLVISRDMKALARAREIEGVQTLQESGTPELNHALQRANRMLISWGATATLILPADVPLVSVADIEAIIDLGYQPHTLVIAPDRHQDGTNAMFTRPPDIIELGFGRGSYRQHVLSAKRVGAAVQVYESERMALDVDIPEDLTYYRELATRLGEEIIFF
jgi:2-phospho-L-lactate/phosphoenolpyruvate guanylyltransferase